MCAEDFYLLNVSAPASIDNCVVRAKIACAWSFGRRLFPSHEAHTDSIPTRCARDGHAPLRAPLFSQVPAPEVPGAQVPGAQVPLCRALARADSNHRKSKTRTLSKSGFRRLATVGVSLCASLVTAADQQRPTFFCECALLLLTGMRRLAVQVRAQHDAAHAQRLERRLASLGAVARLLQVQGGGSRGDAVPRRRRSRHSRRRLLPRGAHGTALLFMRQRVVLF